MASYLADLDHFPSPDEAPEYYVDYDETGPFTAEGGSGECAVMTATSPDLADLAALSRGFEGRPRPTRSRGRSTPTATGWCWRRRSKTA